MRIRWHYFAIRYRVDLCLICTYLSFSRCALGSGTYGSGFFPVETLDYETIMTLDRNSAEKPTLSLSKGSSSGLRKKWNNDTLCLPEYDGPPAPHGPFPHTLDPKFH